ncbi:YozD family protein [Niallia sp. FSL R7-0271]|uniref:YozD family protein n=1 Tax=Niallia sp. FSL R7-0271 TaxID=2921678 RepID=UPI0030FA0C9D
MLDKEIIVDTKEVEDYFYKELIKRGFIPEKKEIEEIADIVFDYLLSIGVLEEEDDE